MSFPVFPELYASLCGQDKLGEIILNDYFKENIMKKLIYITLFLTFLCSCSTGNLNIYVANSAKTLYDFSIERVSEKRGILTVSKANNKYIILTPSIRYTESVMEIPSVLNMSCIIQLKDIPELINILEIIFSAYDQVLQKGSSRVIKFYASSENKNINLRIVNNEIIANNNASIILEVEYIKGPKSLMNYSGSGYTKLTINNHEMILTKNDVFMILNDINKAYLSMQNSK